MGNPPQDDLTGFAETVREAYITPPDEAVEARHLAAMAAEAHTVRDQQVISVPAHGLKEALVTRFRTAALGIKLAALTLFAALATGGLATAGVISLPDSLPGVASDRAKAVHEAIEGSDPSAERCAFGHRVAEAASDGAANPEENGCDGAEVAAEDAAAEDAAGKSVEAQQNGATPEEGAGQAFGDSVSDRASGGEPKDGGGREFGESVSDEAQQLVPRPTPQPQAGPETGDTQSQEGQEIGDTRSQGGREIAESHGGGPPQD